MLAPFLKIHYNSVVQKDLLLIGLESAPCALPAPNKIVLSIKTAKLEEKLVLSSMLALDLVANQKPILTRGQIVNNTGIIGCKLTLRKTNMYLFLLKLIFVILPGIKQFEGFSYFSESNTFSLTLQNVLVFKELQQMFDLFEGLNSLSCHIHFKGVNKSELSAVGRSILFCFV